MRRALEITAGIGLSAFAWWLKGALLLAAPPPPSAADASSKIAPTSARPAPTTDDASAPAPGRERPDPVASYELRVSLDPEQHTLRGEGAITWKNTSRAPQSELYIHLYLNAFKSDRTVFLRRKDEGFRGGGAVNARGSIDVRRFHVREMDADVWPAGATTPGDPEDETDIRVPLPRPVEPGASITIEVAWDARLPSITLRTGYEGRFHMVGQWFPKLARLEEDGRWAHFPFYRLSEFYADFGAYDVTIDVPEAFVVGATGSLVHEARAGGRVERRFVQEDVHDFAFAAWDEFIEATATSDDGTALRCLVPRGHERSAAIELETARFGLARFGAAFGRYPYRTLTIVHPPEGAVEAGGMEYPTLITTGGAWFLPWTGARVLEQVTLHELAHQWFYGLVATNENEHPFMDEGLTSYAEIDAMEALFPGASVGSALGLSLGFPAFNRAFSMEAHENAPVAQPAASFINGGDYGALVYARTATALLTLAGVYGADVIRGAIGAYARRYRFGHPGPDQLLASVRAAAGDEAADALRAALFDRGSVDYVAGDVLKDAALVRRRGSIVLPVEIDLIGADGSIERARWDARESAAWIPYRGSSSLVAVVIDPGHRVLLDGDLSNNAQRAGGGSFAWRALERASFASQLGLLMLSP